MRTSLVTFVSLLALTTTAHAGNELSIGGMNRALRTPSADALTADSYSGGQLGYARDLRLGIPGLALWATGSLQWGGATGSLFDLATELSQSAYLVGARARYRVVSHVDATAHVQVGVAHTTLALTDAMDHEAYDAHWGGIAEASVGIELLAVQQTSFSLGLRLELGYTKASAVALAPRPQQPDDGTLRLPTMQASFGSLDLSGPCAAVGVVSRF